MCIALVCDNWAMWFISPILMFGWMSFMFTFDAQTDVIEIHVRVRVGSMRITGTHMYM